jgi:hypothetical protein
MQLSQPIIKPYRFARILIWAKAMLAWLALALFSETRINRRHIRRRYHFISRAWIERLVGTLAIIRATELAALPRIKRPPPRNAAPPGFRRRAWRAGVHRAILGARLRKALKHKDPRRHFERLFAALSDIDAFVRRYLLKRVLRRFTKRRAVVMAASPAVAVLALAVAAPGAADTS